MAALKRFPVWSWVLVLIGMLYFVLPLIGTLIFALQKERDQISLSAFQSALSDPLFLSTFAFSSVMAVITILVSTILILPTAYWVRLRVPQMRPVIDFITLLPFVIPGIVLVFGLIRTYGHRLAIGPIVIPALTEVSTEALLLGSYIILSLPFMYRSIDNGMRAVDVKTLTEAAQSLGAGWGTILLRVVVPNLRTALLSGALLTYAIVVGEFTISGFLVGDQRAFGPYLVIVGNHHAYDAAALTLLSFALTLAAMLVIQYVSRGKQLQVGAGR